MRSYIDNDMANWNAWGNSMWPSVYLIDRRGYLRYWWYGELNWKGAQGEKMMRQRIQELLELFELTNKAGTYLDGFSHGMQQKIAIIGAILHKPKVILLDEPTVGLDPRSARLVKDLLMQHAQEGNAVFFSSHILEIVENMCDRVIIINHGEVIADSPVSELRHMEGDQSLEDIFLELTGGKDVDDLVKELGK